MQKGAGSRDKWRASVHHAVLVTCMVAPVLAFLSACSSSAALKDELIRAPMSEAQPPADSGVLAEIAARAALPHGRQI